MESNKSNTQNILLRLDVPSECLVLSAQQWGKIIKPLAEGKKNLNGQPYICDPADVLSAMVSQFLVEKNFEQYLENDDNFKPLCERIRYYTNPS